MTDKEIIKAFEKCIENDILQKNCGICDYHKHGARCMDVLFRQILDVIHRQKSEAIEAYAERLKSCYTNDIRYDRKNAHTSIDKLFDNIDNLKKEMVGEQ